MRRALLRTLAALPPAWAFFSARTIAKQAKRRVRPADSAWPTQRDWEGLNRSVGGRLLEVHSPLALCLAAPAGADCERVFSELRNP